MKQSIAAVIVLLTTLIGLQLVAPAFAQGSGINVGWDSTISRSFDFQMGSTDIPIPGFDISFTSGHFVGTLNYTNMVLTITFTNSSWVQDLHAGSYTNLGTHYFEGTVIVSVTRAPSIHLVTNNVTFTT